MSQPPPPSTSSFPNDSASSAAAAEEEDDDDNTCAICLCPLSDEQSITLSCSHRWHLSCLREQLRQAQPSPARRLVFNGIRCAICSQVCSHPLIDPLITTSTDLLAQVDALALEQARVDNLYTNPQYNNPTSPFYHNMTALARSVYAFYLCATCRKPYFGGTVACADAAEVDLPPADRQCVACSPRTSAVMAQCRQPDVHRQYYVWKCRFCCQPASFLCYANTHLCARCHDIDDGTRVQTVLNIPTRACEGRGQCEVPMRDTQTCHDNGPEPECEQLLYCAWCASSPNSSSSSASPRDRNASEYESPNMIFNPSGAHSLTGWYSQQDITVAIQTREQQQQQQQQRNNTFVRRYPPTHHPHYAPTGLRWSTEQSDFPFGMHTTNFVSSFQWATQAQCVDLTKFIKPETFSNRISLTVRVSARILARTDCPSKFRMRAVLFDTQFNPLERFDSNVISPPVDFWDIVDFSFAETPDARFVVLAIYGKDARFWQGNYGAKVANCSVKVACPRHNNNDQTTAAEEETQLPFIGDAFDNISVDSIGPIDAIARFYGVVRQSQQQHTVGRVQNRGVHRSNVQPPSLEDLRRNRLTYFRLPAVIENQNNDDDDDDDDDMDDFIDDEYDGSGSGGEQIDESGDVGQNSGDGQRRPSRGRNDADHESQGQSLLRWLGFL